MINKINEASCYIQQYLPWQPEIAIILGSGLGPLADIVENPITLDYKDIPHFPTPTIASHAGKLVIGTIRNKKVVILNGRFHYYEGHDINTNTLPVRVFRKLGIETLIVTNACVVETPSIYLDMSAEENLKQQYRILGMPSFEGIKDILGLVGLAQTRDKKARDFSLGMRQRLGIAIALAGDPDFLILDEPVNGLDPQGIIEMRELILKLNQEHQITVLISSHILDELSKMATHYGFIDNGRIVKEISAAELQAACRKCVHVEVSDTKLLARVLDGMEMEYKILSNTEADIFAKVMVSQLAAALEKVNCEIVSMHERDEDLENYFVSLVGGGRYA